jgi:hypothetical protein
MPFEGQLDFWPSVTQVNKAIQSQILIQRTRARRKELSCLQTSCNVEIVPNLIEGAALATDSDRVSMSTLECAFNISERVGLCRRRDNSIVGKELDKISILIRVSITAAVLARPQLTSWVGRSLKTSTVLSK